MNLTLPISMPGVWHAVKRSDPRARKVVDGIGFDGQPHYSRQTPGAAEFMSNGRTLVLLTDCGRAVWGAIENRDPVGGLHWRVSMFRNESGHLSSGLVVEATDKTFMYWRRRYRGLPAAPLRTEVDPDKTRRKRDPGRCFRRAGWVVVGETTTGRGRHVVLEAPGETERIPRNRGTG